MEELIQKESVSNVLKQASILFVFMLLSNAPLKIFGQPQQQNCDIRLDAVVSSSGNLSNDGKGTYSTGKDWIAVWLNPTRWPDQSFHICMAWPFDHFRTCDSATALPPSGIRGTRTLLHRIDKPVIKDNKSLGVFTGPGGGNDIAMSRPLTPTIEGFTDMVIGSTISPQSTEVRFCNSDCTEYYSLVFGDGNAWGRLRDRRINGEGSTKPTIVRTSEATWTINFPAGTIGRLWNRAQEVPTSALYYYEGSLEIKKQ